MATKILINQTAFLGDLVLGTPLFKKLRELFPQCEITLVCRKGLGKTLQSLKLVDHFYEINKNEGATYSRVLSEIGDQQFDLLLSPHESLRSALFVSKIKATKKIGYKKWWNFLFFDERINKNYWEPEAIRQISLLETVWPEFNLLRNNISPIPKWASMVIPMPIEPSVVAAKFGLHTPYVCLFPGSVWATKQWTEEGFIQTGQAYAKNNFSVLIMGGPGEETLCQRIAEAIPQSQSLAGKTNLLETTSILAKASVVITNDSGGQHLAALSGVPTVAVFGPTIPDFGFIPWNNQAVIVETKGLACRPCGKHGHKLCPIGTHVCMKQISADQVLLAAEKLSR